MPRPSPQEVAAARDRYRKNLDAVNGPQTMDQFFESPYMRNPGRGMAWHWDEDMMRIDCVIIAENDYHENRHAQ